MKRIFLYLGLFWLGKANAYIEHYNPIYFWINLGFAISTLVLYSLWKDKEVQK